MLNVQRSRWNVIRSPREIRSVPKLSFSTQTHRTPEEKHKVARMSREKRSYNYVHATIVCVCVFISMFVSSYECVCAAYVNDDIIICVV